MRTYLSEEIDDLAVVQVHASGGRSPGRHDRQRASSL